MSMGYMLVVWQRGGIAVLQGAVSCTETGGSLTGTTMH